jgi:hypothetical protein
VLVKYQLLGVYLIFLGVGAVEKVIHLGRFLGDLWLQPVDNFLGCLVGWGFWGCYLLDFLVEILGAVE